MTTIMAGVNERRREIGIKKAIGAKNASIVLEFLGESAVITSVGAIFGLLIGILFCGVCCKLLSVSMAVDSGLIIFAVFAAIIIGGIFSIYPALKAAKMYPIEALR